MDLHELFASMQAAGASRAEVVFGVDWGTRPDCTEFRCGCCGYVTDMIEVLAIHAINQHSWHPGLVPEWAHPAGGTPLVITRFYEADSPTGPWSEVGESGPKKRYLQRIDRPLR